MQKLDFVLNDFTRIVYSSKEMEDLWKGRVTQIANRIHQLEIETVRRNLRKAGLVNLSVDELRDNAAELTGQKICVVPVALVPDSGLYSSTTQNFIPGEPYQYRAIICRADVLPEFFSAFTTGDNKVMGKLLGYPTCCIDFFEKAWPGKVDTTFEMIDQASDVTLTDYSPWCNVLLRYIGCRMVFHLPCEFTCPMTDKIGLKFFKLFHDYFPREARWLEEMLKWPTKWTALHGVAEIVTPAFKIATRTDSWSDLAQLTLTGIKDLPIELADQDYPRIDSWTSNGFTSKRAMDANHKGVVSVLSVLSKPIERVIDLGSGAGDLLVKLDANLRIGVEADYNRFMEGIEYNKDPLYFHMTILNFCKNVWTEPTLVTIIGQNRLQEVSNDDAFTIINKIREKSQYLVVTNYDYDDTPNINLGNGLVKIGETFNSVLYRVAK